MLIVIEGLDGCGKSTQIKNIIEKLKFNHVDFTSIKLPNYNSHSGTVVKEYLEGEYWDTLDDANAYAVSLLYATDRICSYNSKDGWKNDYELHKLVLSDRYTTSNAIFQTAKLPKSEWDSYLNWLFDMEYNKVGLPKPNITIFLDVPIEISQKLMSNRYNGDETKKDLHEANTAYLQRCREAALYVANKFNWQIISCVEGDEMLPIDVITDKIYSYIENLF